jgi:uncharacterized protein YbjT (DUF2867 family)
MVLSPQAVTLRRALFELHGAIIVEERAGYERRAGQVNAAAFLRVLIEDEAYAWLRPLSALIVRMDDEEEDARPRPAGLHRHAVPDALRLADRAEPRRGLCARRREAGLAVRYERMARTVALAGATGLVGKEILQGLVADPSVAAIHVLARRALEAPAAKVVSHLVDFRSLPALPRVDEVFLALGTTIKVAGSQEAFRAVDFDANLAVARAALAAGARRAGLVSAMGASAKSGIFYSRVKGELEDALAALPFEGLVIARPSILAGDRGSLGQPERRGEKIALAISRLLGPLFPANYRSVAVADVARSLLTRVPAARGREIVLSGAMR